MIKAIIFDYGGVVAGTKSESSGIYDLCKKFSKAIGISTNKVYFEYHKYWNKWKLGMVSMNEIYDKFLRDLKSDYPPKELIKITLNHASLNKPVYNLVKRLKNKYKIVCLTNHGREWFLHDYKRFKLNIIFSKLYASYHLKMAKPHPEIYRYVLKDLKVKPGECLFIDDLQRNTEIAKQLGMNVIHFKSYSQLKKDLNKLKIKGA